MATAATIWQVVKSEDIKFLNYISKFSHLIETSGEEPKCVILSLVDEPEFVGARSGFHIIGRLVCPQILHHQRIKHQYFSIRRLPTCRGRFKAFVARL